MRSSTTSCELALRLEKDGLRKWQLYTWFFLTYPPDDRSIKSQAQTNFEKCIKETGNILDTQHIYPHIKARSLSPPLLPISAHSRSSELEYNSTNEHPIGVDLEGLIQSRNFTLKVIGLLKDSNDPSDTLDLQLKGDATLDEVMVAIKDAGASLTILPMFSHHV